MTDTTTMQIFHSEVPEMEELILPNTRNAKHFRHGYKTAGRYSAEYSVWMNMRARCNNPKNSRFATYGARGIKVCERWENDFLNFLTDMGRRPSPEHSIERKNNDKNYEPGNCVWATRKEQARNRRTSRFIVVDDASLTMAEWSEITGINRQTIHARLKAGWDEKRALNTPVRARASKCGSEHVEANVFLTLPELSERRK